MEKIHDTKVLPRDALIAKDLVGFETKGEGTDSAAVKTGLSKSGKAVQPSWAHS